MQKIFFGVISLMVVTAAILQFVLVYEYTDQDCGIWDLTSAPTIAGSCVLGSFLFNGIWVFARKSASSATTRVALFLWTATFTIGVAAAGATLGKTRIYELCKDTDINIELLQYCSVALLVLSVAAPHALKKGMKAGASDATKPLTKDDVSQQKPLIFL